MIYRIVLVIYIIACLGAAFLYVKFDKDDDMPIILKKLLKVCLLVIFVTPFGMYLYDKRNRKDPPHIF